MTDEKKNDNYFEASVEDLLGEQTSQELDRRDGEWSAFSASVFRRVDEEDLGLARMTLEDQAIELFRQDVDGELSEMAPSFDVSFKEGIEQRIWNAAREKPSFMDRVRGLMSRVAGDGIGWSVGWAGAMAAALAIVVANGWTINSPQPQIAENIGGQVTVQSVSFEGTVTVMPNDGVTVIWLSDDASS